MRICAGVRIVDSVDIGTNYATLLANRTISANGSTFENVVNKPFKWLRPVFVSEAGGTAATVTLSIAAA